MAAGRRHLATISNNRHEVRTNEDHLLGMDRSSMITFRVKIVRHYDHDIFIRRFCNEEEVRAQREAKRLQNVEQVERGKM